MKKSFTILMALVITFFTVPFGGLTALADELDPENLAKGVYTLDYTFLEEGTDNPSAMDGFTNGPAYVNVDEDGNQLVRVTLTGASMIKWFKVNGQDVTVLEENEEANTKDVEFKVENLTEKQEGHVYVEVPDLYSTEHEVDLVFHISSLESIKDDENLDDSDGSEEPETPEESENDESVIELDNGSYTMNVSYLHADEEKPSSMARYMDESVFLTVDGDKVEVTITVNNDETVTKLQVDGKEAIEKVVDGDKRHETFEFDSLESIVSGYVEYQAPYQGGIHKGQADFRIVFKKESKLDAEASDKPGADINEPVETEVGLNNPVDVQKGEVINIKGDKNNRVKMPVDLPENVKLEIKSAIDKVKNQGNLVVAGEVYEFNFSGIEHFEGVFELVMGYDVDEYDPDQVNIYYYDEEKEEWIKQDGEVKDGTITIKPTHFSTYGVFATESEDESEGNVDGESKEIDYVVKHATEDKTSSADSFFTKPAHLIERDGETYIQLTIKSWGMIDWLRTEHGDVTIIEENADTAIVEFKVTGELSDAINLSMQVTVPGLYEMEHNVRLFLDVTEENDTGNEEKEPGDGEKETGNKEKENNQSTSDEKIEVVPEAAYTINYVVKHATEDRTSAADSFFVKPAYLLYGENGAKYIQLIINDWDMIDWLRTEHGDVIVVKENADGSALIQFKVVGDLSDEVLLSMSVTVPGLYSMEHDARLIFDVDSQNEVDPNEFQIIVDSADPQGPGKPNFGNGDSNTDNGNGKATNSGNNNNPQTGDTTNIFLYVMLLMGSLIPLAIKLRRRFV